jgi:hypothetical protein
MKPKPIAVIMALSAVSLIPWLLHAVAGSDLAGAGSGLTGGIRPPGSEGKWIQGVLAASIWPGILALAYSAVIVYLWPFEKSDRLNLVLKYIVMVYCMSVLLLLFMGFVFFKLTGPSWRVPVTGIAACFVFSFLFALFVRTIFGLNLASWACIMVGIIGVLSILPIVTLKLSFCLRYALTGMALSLFLGNAEFKVHLEEPPGSPAQSGSEALQG